MSFCLTAASPPRLPNLRAGSCCFARVALACVCPLPSRGLPTGTPCETPLSPHTVSRSLCPEPFIHLGSSHDSVALRPVQFHIQAIRSPSSTQRTSPCRLSMLGNAVLHPVSAILSLRLG